MSLEIDGLGPTQPPALSRTAAESSAGSFAAALSAAGGDAVSVELDSSFPDTPPPEVAQAITRAAQAYDQLNATGRQVHFIAGAPGATLTVQLQDLDGNPLSTISVSDALRIAGGEGLN